MLHKDDLSRIQMKVWCPVEDEPISRSDTVKGYEYSPGEYVVITDEDLERVPLKTVRSIEIEQFTKAKRDDAAVRFVKSAYYLEPDKIGRKAFYLLKSVLEEDGLTAICKVVIKDREALAALDPFGDTWTVESFSPEPGLLPETCFTLTLKDPARAQQTLARLAQALERTKDRGAGSAVLFVTVDPERDTLARLHEYAQSFGAQFVGLRGTPQQLEALTKRYRVGYSRGVPDAKGDYEVTHGTGVFVFDGTGRSRLLVLPRDSTANITADLDRLAAGIAG